MNDGSPIADFTPSVTWHIIILTTRITIFLSYIWLIQSQCFKCDDLGPQIFSSIFERLFLIAKDVMQFYQTNVGWKTICLPIQFWYNLFRVLTLFPINTCVNLYQKNFVLNYYVNRWCTHSCLLYAIISLKG